MSKPAPLFQRTPDGFVRALKAMVKLFAFISASVPKFRVSEDELRKYAELIQAARPFQANPNGFTREQYWEILNDVEDFMQNLEYHVRAFLCNQKYWAESLEFVRVNDRKGWERTHNEIEKGVQELRTMRNSRNVTLGEVVTVYTPLHAKLQAAVTAAEEKRRLGEKKLRVEQDRQRQASRVSRELSEILATAESLL